MNDIGGIRLKTAKPLVFDGYTTNRLTGSFILIEQGTNATVAAGMLSAPTEAAKPEYSGLRDLKNNGARTSPEKANFPDLIPAGLSPSAETGTHRN